MSPIAMKKILASIVFCLVTSISAFAQNPAEVIEKLSRIKFFESTSEDVEKLFEGDQDIKFTEENVSSVSTKKMSFYIEYSSGSCDFESEDWNVPESKVTGIRISLKQATAPAVLGINLSGLRKERTFTNSSKDFVYHDKNLGVSYHVCDGKISHIEFFPPKDKISFLCADKPERKRFYERQDWEEEKGETPIIRGFANVNEVTLSTNEIILNCYSVNSTIDKNCIEDAKLIEVQVEAETAPCSSWDFYYDYTVSGGRIIGYGEKVVWDLSGVKPGKYTITAAVDNGCGACGTTRTKEVIIKKCADCE